MSDHTTAIVPLDSWCYSAPELLSAGRPVDIGLLAEALVYYDSVLINVATQPQLAEILRWFLERGTLRELLALIRGGIVRFYDYAFSTAAVLDSGTGRFSIWNIQDQAQAEPETFEQRFLYHRSVEERFPNSRQRADLYKAFRGRVIEVKAKEFGRAVDEAREDYGTPRRNALILQAFADELYRMRGLGKAPEITTIVERLGDGTARRITWNVDFAELARIAGPELNFGLGTPLTAGALSNRLIWSAAQLGCDLYLARPMAMLVGDKLYETTERAARKGSIIEELRSKVEFPDIRSLVNSDGLTFDAVLQVRDRGCKFRRWLQEEADRDRDAIIAYHNEVARELGLIAVGRKVLSMFGVMGGGALGSVVGAAVAGPAGAALGGAVGTASGYAVDVAAKIGADWKPVVFGEWLRHRIQKLVQEV